MKCSYLGCENQAETTTVGLGNDGADQEYPVCFNHQGKMGAVLLTVEAS
jgi:hypothetical protein